jgi:hypothetical protein
MGKVAVGLASSLPAAFATSKLVKSFLWNTQPNDPMAKSAGLLVGASEVLLGEV